MYTLFDVVSDAEGRAESAAFEDRLRYSKFIEAAERLAERDGLIVGGASANRLLLGDPRESGVPAPVDFSSFRYEFYSAQAVQDARALADALYAVDPTVRGRYTTMRTKVPDVSLAVEVDGRDMFSVTALKVRRGTRMADVMIPSRRPAQFAKDANGAALMLLCSGPEIQLIEVYTALCNPARAGDWGGLLAVEAGLRKIFDAEIWAKIEEAVDAPRPARGLAARELAPAGGPLAERLVRALRVQYAIGASRVIVGCGAAALIAGTVCRTGAASHLQVVTVGRLEAEAEEIVAIARRVGCEVQWTVGEPNIPIDPRLRRMSVHLVGDGRRELVLDVYNAAAHELIPYTTVGALSVTKQGGDALTSALLSRRRERSRAREEKGPASRDGAAPRYRALNLAWLPSELPPGLKIGTPFTVMRFRLADMWTIQMLLKMGIVDTGFAKGALAAMLTDYKAVAAAYDRLLDNGEPEALAARCLPLSDYIGRFDDPDIAQKREAQSGSRVRFHPPYMPLLGTRNDGNGNGNGHGNGHGNRHSNGHRNRLASARTGFDSDDSMIDVYSDE